MDEAPQSESIDETEAFRRIDEEIQRLKSAPGDAVIQQEIVMTLEQVWALVDLLTLLPQDDDPLIQQFRAKLDTIRGMDISVDLRASIDRIAATVSALVAENLSFQSSLERSFLIDDGAPDMTVGIGDDSGISISPFDSDIMSADPEVQERNDREQLFLLNQVHVEIGRLPAIPSLEQAGAVGAQLSAIIRRLREDYEVANEVFVPHLHYIVALVQRFVLMLNDNLTSSIRQRIMDELDSLEEKCDCLAKRYRLVDSDVANL